MTVLRRVESTVQLRVLSRNNEAATGRGASRREAQPPLL